MPLGVNLQLWNVSTICCNRSQAFTVCLQDGSQESYTSAMSLLSSSPNLHSFFLFFCFLFLQECFYVTVLIFFDLAHVSHLLTFGQQFQNSKETNVGILGHILVTERHKERKSVLDNFSLMAFLFQTILLFYLFTSCGLVIILAHISIFIIIFITHLFYFSSFSFISCFWRSVICILLSIVLYKEICFLDSLSF